MRKALYILTYLAVLPLVALAQVEVPYTALQWINPEGDAASLTGVYSGIDNQLGYFRLLGDSTLIVTEGVRTVENGETWYRVFHTAYDFNLQQRNVVYSGKAPVYNTNTSGMAFKSTQNYLLDINGYCIGDQSNCNSESYYLMSKVYNSNLSLLDVDSIAVAMDVNLISYYSDDSFVSASTYPQGYPPTFYPIIWFEDSSQSHGYINQVELSPASLGRFFVGYNSSGFFFHVEPLGNSTVSKFERYQDGQLQQSFVLDSITGTGVSSVRFVQNDDGGYLLNYYNAGKNVIVKLNSSFEQIWRQEIVWPQVTTFLRNLCATYENENLVCFLYTTTHEIRLIRMAYDSGNVVSDEVLYNLPLAELSRLLPYQSDSGIWCFSMFSNGWESDTLEPSMYFKIYRINYLESSVSVFQLQVPPIAGTRRWKFEPPVIMGDTVFVHGYYNRESLTDFEEVPQPYFLAQYNLPQTNSLSNTPISTALSLAPNPAQHQVSLYNLPPEALEVRVVDLQGRLVFTQRSNRENTLDIPIAQLSKGMYWVTVQGANGVKTQKFIKH